MLDGTVFQIVDNLAEIQQVTEKQAFQMRQQLVAGHNGTEMDGGADAMSGNG